MSDNKQDNNQEEFEAMFEAEIPQKNDSDSQDDDTNVIIEVSESSHDFDVVTPVAEEEFASSSDPIEDDYISASDSSSAIEDDLHEFNDLDDGVDESGIFAPIPEGKKAKKKSSSPLLMAGVALIAIGGAGGFFYMNNPEIVHQIKENIVQDTGAGSLLSDMTSLLGGAGNASGSGGVGGLDQGMPPQPAAYNETMEEVVIPPIEEAVLDNELVAPPVPNEEQGMVIGQVPPEVTPDMSSDSAPDGAVIFEINPDVTGDVVSDLPVETSVEDVVVDGAVDLPGGADMPPVVDEAVVEIVPPAVAPVAEEVAQDAPSEPDVIRAVPAEGNAKIFRPKELAPQKITLVDDISNEKPSEAELNAPKGEPETDTGNSLVYFDAPPGEVIGRLPTPSMNPSRGQTESIIVVHKNGSSGVSKVSSKTQKSAKTPSKVVIETTSLESKIVAADRAMKLNRLDAAQTMFDELYALNPRDPRILMGRAVLFQKIGENARAISTYEELLAVSPNNAQAAINLSGLIRNDHPAVALSKLLELRQKYPDNPTLVAQLAISLADSGNLEDAVMALDKAISMQPNNPQHYFNRAIMSERMNQIPQAISLYEKALEVDAVSGGGLSRGVVYDRLTRLRSY
ncbi:MAG TPA: tetratricopeptide repeat protein [Alphaproteobacteria bacterium]|nr:tetratricopeptide repeat protein [Alphaproteobacteria bacterium]HOO49991.1 tetratricopeptide repeat protein [Alphaproteobacteria bacterium]